jgi:hypothetical protein
MHPIRRTTMSTTEKAQPVNPGQNGRNAYPAQAEAPFRDPTPTTPLELPTQPSRSLGELIRSRAKAIAAGLTTAAVAVGLVALGTSGKEAVAGTPVAAGQGGDAPAAGPLIPGAEQGNKPEVVTGNLCDQIAIEDLAEWTTHSRSAFPPAGRLEDGKVECFGGTPQSDDLEVETVAAGTWKFPQEGASAYPIKYISMQIVKDQLPDGSSFFQRRQRTFSEEPQSRQIGGTEVVTMSSSGTTLVNVPETDVDFIFTIKMPNGIGGDSQDTSVYAPLHRAEVDALDQLGPQLGLTREA